MRKRKPLTAVLAIATTATLAAVIAVSPASAATTSDPVLVGAGDIALCGSSGAETTAKLIDGIDGTVFTAGDNVQLIGAPIEYSACYSPTWGRFKSRTKPAPGNHDYYWPNASGYYKYFGTAAGDPAKGYYSYDLGTWHVVALNSNCAEVGGCGAGSPQEQWLRSDLAASRTTCTVAYWHHPLFSSNGSTSEVKPLFQALYDYRAEIVVSGHNHVYERFAPQTPDGVAANDGVRQFVVGTGGMILDTFGTIAANSQARIAGTYGVLKLTLRAGGYDWQFVPEAGRTSTDTGSANCG